MDSECEMDGNFNNYGYEETEYDYFFGQLIDHIQKGKDVYLESELGGEISNEFLEYLNHTDILFQAIDGTLKAVELVLKTGIEPNKKRNLHYGDFTDITPLMYACSPKINIYDRREKVKLLLKYGATYTKEDIEKYSYLKED